MFIAESPGTHNKSLVLVGVMEVDTRSTKSLVLVGGKEEDTRSTKSLVLVGEREGDTRSTVATRGCSRWMTECPLEDSWDSPDWAGSSFTFTSMSPYPLSKTFRVPDDSLPSDTDELSP
ncbi:hypothetical protein J6590_039390 [Homalodisca vitripennis]|nr:hypothetical protein J6590_039390 [Homalodisca vitripennis]